MHATMNRTLFWRLVWKEFRMLRGFWVALAAFTVLAQLIALLTFTLLGQLNSDVPSILFGWAFGFELGAQEIGVDDVAVMAEGDGAVRAFDQKRLSVFDSAGAGGGVARVARSREAPEIQKVFLLEDL